MGIATLKLPDGHYVNIIVDLAYRIKLKSDLDMNTAEHGTY